jgi:hypothetical protein
MRMSALMARLAALGLFLLWNFHTGLHFMHGECHEHVHEDGRTYSVSAEEDDCGACHFSVAPGLVGQQPADFVPAYHATATRSDADALVARLYSCADGRGPPVVLPA